MEERVTALEELARSTAAILARMNSRLDSIGLRLDGIDLRLNTFDRRFEEVNRRFEEVDRRYADLGRRLDGIDTRLDVMDRRNQGLERRVDMIADTQRSDLRWILGLMISGFGATLAGFATLLGVMAHGFHWL